MGYELVGAVLDGLRKCGSSGALRGEVRYWVAVEGEEGEVEDTGQGHVSMFDYSSWEESGLRNDTCNRVASNLQLLQGVQMRHAYPRHLVSIRKRHGAHVASVADRSQVFEIRLPQHECWNRTCQ